MKTFEIVFIWPPEFSLPAAPPKPPQYISNLSKPFLVSFRFLLFALPNRKQHNLVHGTARNSRTFGRGHWT
jgi:hypothetical protein